MTSGNRSALNKYYYPLSEATKVLKAQGKNLSVSDLLHYGVQGIVRFFIHLPSEIRVRQIPEPPLYSDNPQPNLLILSPLQCGEIECNKVALCSDFPSAYSSLYSYSENPLYTKSLQYQESMIWRTIDNNDEPTQIQITPKTIHLAHTELNELIQLIQQQENQYSPPIEFTPQFDEQLQQEINHRCYSFEDALKIAKDKINGFTEIDLLRYGYFEKLTFLIQLPNNLSVSIATQGNPVKNKLIPNPKPDLLALHPEDCYQIEIFGSLRRTDFKVGFLCHNRTLLPILPKLSNDFILENIELSDVKTIINYRLRVDTETDGTLRLRTYNQIEPYALEIDKNSLYIIRSEFDRLISADSTSDKIEQIELPHIPEFTISDVTRYNLSPKNFITLSDAATLAKCYPNELLVYASQGTIELLTPVPCEISLCQTRQAVTSIDELRESKSKYFTSVDQTPQVLVLENNDCVAIAMNGRVKKGYFKQGYSFNFGQLIQQTPYYLEYTETYGQANTRNSETKKRPGVWLTFYLDKPKEIDITVDRIFIELSKFKELIKLSPDILKSKNDSYDEPVRCIVNQLNSGSPETNAAIRCEPSRTNLTDDAVLLDNISPPIETITEKEFEELAGISRTTITNRTKNKTKYPEFPTKFKNKENGHVYFLKTEVDAWIRKNPPRNRKQKQKKNQS